MTGAIDVLPVMGPLREVTAEISDWQTFPQLYVKGELVGGCDIVEEMAASGELAEMLGAEQAADQPPSAKQEMQSEEGFSSPPMQIENS